MMLMIANDFSHSLTSVVTKAIVSNHVSLNILMLHVWVIVTIVIKGWLLMKESLLVWTLTPTNLSDLFRLL